jgi:hypothetical protein
MRRFDAKRSRAQRDRRIDSELIRQDISIATDDFDSILRTVRSQLDISRSRLKPEAMP